MSIIFVSIILIGGCLYAQAAHYTFLANEKMRDKTILASGELSILREEFDEYKKRVDQLMLRAGFKL